MKFKHNDKVRLLVERICGNGQEGVIRVDNPPGRNSPEGPWVKFPDGWSFLRDYGEVNFELIKEDTMKERVLRDDEIMKRGDIVHRVDGYTWIVTGLAGNKVNSMPEILTGEYTKVTRPRGEKMKEKKDYPAKFYAQRCMGNDDPTDLSISVDPNDLDMNYPVLEITYSKKKGFKVRLVTITEKRTYVTKEVK